MICAWTETSSAETGSSATMKAGTERDRARDADALALAAGELARIAVHDGRRQADLVEQARRRARGAPPASAIRPKASSGSAMMSADACGAGSASRTGPGTPSACAGASGASRRRTTARHVRALEEDAARRSARSGAGAGGRVVDLPQPELADERQRLAAADLEADRSSTARTTDRPPPNALAAASSPRRSCRAPRRAGAAAHARAAGSAKQAARWARRPGTAAALLDGASVDPLRAARAERAARPDVPTAAAARPGSGRALSVRRRAAGSSCSRPSRVGMARPVEQIVRRRPSSTTRPAYITTTRSAHVGDDAEIVRDEQDRRVR